MLSTRPYYLITPPCAPSRVAGEPHGPFPISSLLQRPLWLRCLQSASLAAPGSFHKTRCKVIKDLPAPSIPLLKVSERFSLCWGSPLQKTLKPPKNLSPARPTPLPQILRSFVKYFMVDNNKKKYLRVPDTFQVMFRALEQDPTAPQWLLREAACSSAPGGVGSRQRARLSPICL